MTAAEAAPWLLGGVFVLAAAALIVALVQSAVWQLRRQRQRRARQAAVKIHHWREQ